eukprot:1024144-Prymnesium_polylepis.1
MREAELRIELVVSIHLAVFQLVRGFFEDFLLALTRVQLNERQVELATPSKVVELSSDREGVQTAGSGAKRGDSRTANAGDRIKSVEKDEDTLPPERWHRIGRCRSDNDWIWAVGVREDIKGTV